MIYNEITKYDFINEWHDLNKRYEDNETAYNPRDINAYIELYDYLDNTDGAYIYNGIDDFLICTDQYDNIAEYNDTCNTIFETWDDARDAGVDLLFTFESESKETGAIIGNGNGSIITPLDNK